MNTLLRFLGFSEELPLDYAAGAAENARTSADDERETELALRNSIRVNAWRVEAGLPLRPQPQAVKAWHAELDLRFWRAAYRRRHPINAPSVAKEFS